MRPIKNGRFYVATDRIPLMTNPSGVLGVHLVSCPITQRRYCSKKEPVTASEETLTMSYKITP